LIPVLSPCSLILVVSLKLNNISEEQLSRVAMKDFGRVSTSKKISVSQGYLLLGCLEGFLLTIWLPPVVFHFKSKGRQHDDRRGRFESLYSMPQLNIEMKAHPLLQQIPT
jgi:hypothetical protein